MSSKFWPKLNFPGQSVVYLEVPAVAMLMSINLKPLKPGISSCLTKKMVPVSMFSIGSFETVRVHEFQFISKDAHGRMEKKTLEFVGLVELILP